MEGNDLSWLHEEYQKMYEIFEDSPAIQWMKDSILEKERIRVEAECAAE